MSAHTPPKQAARPGIAEMLRWQAHRRSRLVAWVLLFVLILALSACRRPYEFQGTPYTPPRAAPEIVGTNWDGSEFNSRDQQGKVMLIFFGYTFCPDICPMTLARMQQVSTEVGERADEIAVIFVSVDPARDTPERLARYVPAFNRAFYGVHIPEAELTGVKKAFGIFAERSADSTGDEYLVDHSSGLFLVDRQGQLRAVHGHEPQVDVMVEDVQYLLDE